jgi:hypothetical protein
MKNKKYNCNIHWEIQITQHALTSWFRENYYYSQAITMISAVFMVSLYPHKIKQYWSLNTDNKCKQLLVWTC